MKITIILLLFIKVTASDEDSADSIIKGLVSNGIQYDPKKYPFVSNIVAYYDDGTSFACTGSLVKEWYILTAAHCAKGVQKKNINVYLGSEINNKIVRKVTEVYIHKEYDAESSITIGDLSVFKLEEPFPDNPRYINIGGDPKEFDNHNTVDCVNIGFGAINPKNEIGYLGYMIKTKVRHGPTDCKGYLYQKNPLKDLWKRYLCSTGNTTTMVCPGDSGGPMICNDKLYGVCSFLYSTVEGGKMGCGIPNIQTVHVFIHFYLDWVNAIIEPQIGENTVKPEVDPVIPKKKKKNKKKKKKKESSGNSIKPHYILHTILATLLFNVFNIILN